MDCFHFTPFCLFVELVDCYYCFAAGNVSQFSEWRNGDGLWRETPCCYWVLGRSGTGPRPGGGGYGQSAAGA